MPVRAINLKIVVPRSDDQLAPARSLWATHRLVNEATRYYERLFLLCRQRDYQTREAIVTAAEQEKELAVVIGDARRRSGYSGDEEPVVTRSHLRSLYEALVPSALGKDGNAQNSGAFVSPLIDPESAGFTEIFDKISNPPNWLKAAQKEEPSALNAAEAWLQSETGQARLKANGAPAKWMKLAKAQDPEWVMAFVEDFSKKQEEALGTPTLMQKLRGLGVMPLFPSFFARRINGYDRAVSTWDRLAIRLAVAHLLSWESWVNKSAEEFSRREEKLTSFRSNTIVGEIAEYAETLRGYERERVTELQEQANLEAESVTITTRTIRGWRDLRDKWLNKKGANEEALINIIEDEKARVRNRFGDPHFFRWLAKPQHQNIWRSTPKDKDAVSIFATLRMMETLVERSRDTAFMTLPDARRHPRTAQWEPRGGANLKTFELAQDEAGALSVTLPLLRPIDNDLFVENNVAFKLAQTSQLSDVLLEKRGKKYWLTYRTQSGEETEALVGSADLLMDWYWLRQRSDTRQEAGEIGAAYLKIALDAQYIDPVSDPKKTPAALHHFRTAAGANTRHGSEVKEGFRVLAIDLGLRTLATCSVFELKGSVPQGTMSFPVAHLGLHAVHERSFALKLEGENLGSDGEAWRSRKAEELRRLRSALGRFRAIRSMEVEAPEKRYEELTNLSLVAKQNGWDFERGILQKLILAANGNDVVWVSEIQLALREFRSAFGMVVSEWRKRNRAKSDDARSGKSVWAIDYLTNTRRFLMSWSLLSESGQITRLDNERHGVFAKNLLDHISALKDDRLKSGADLIVQAARGFRRGKNGKWERAYNPCHGILFEDLSRYRMRTDRPRRENSQLMKWAHRAVPQEVEMQAQIYGIHVTDTGAAFSSRFHAGTNTPGIRVHPVRKKDLLNEPLLNIIEKQNPGVSRVTLKPGELVQLDGGELFAFCGKEGAQTLHADINAAQNLQRRLFTRHETAFRVATRKVMADGQEIWVPKRLGNRVLGALGSHGEFVPTGHKSGSCRFVELTKREWRKLGGEDAGDDEAVGAEADVEIAALEEQVLELTGEELTYFRDPSGVLLPDMLWYPQKTFWSIVKTKTLSTLRSAP